DRRCLDLIREDGVDRQFGVTIRSDAEIAVLATLELPSGLTADQAADEVGRLFDAAVAFERVDVAMPGDRRRAMQLLAVREAVPAAVNARVGRAQQTIDPRISKTAADMIVPFDRLGDLMSLYDEEFRERGLDAAVWGHISDGNLHPNALPRSFADV